MFTNIFKELKTTKTYYSAEQRRLGICLCSKVDKTKDPKKPKKQQNRAAYKITLGGERNILSNKVLWTQYIRRVVRQRHVFKFKYFFFFETIMEGARYVDKSKLMDETTGDKIEEQLKHMRVLFDPFFEIIINIEPRKMD
jgi:hypothetical protein